MFCEAFGITKIEAPSTARKKAQKGQSRPKPKVPPKQPKSFVTKEQPKPNPKKKVVKKGKPVVCYKCGKPGHRDFQCKTEQKINELFSGDPDLKQKLLALLTQEALESDDDYYAKESEESDYESSPLQALNVITSKPHS